MASESVHVDKKSCLLRLAHTKIRSELEQSWWTYPIARFFGHALYEYRYDIDFSECTAAINQERNLILYQSYCNLLGSLVAKRVLDCGHETKPQDVIMGMIGFAYIHNSEDEREGILNLLRAVHGVHQFGCVVMRYCNYFKCLCLEDMRTCITSADLKLHTFWKQMMDSLSHCIFMKENVDYYEELQKVFELRKHFILPSVLTSIPYICEIGIKLNSDPDYDNLMKDMHTQFATANSHKKASEYAKCAKVKGKVLIDKEKASEDKSKKLGDKDITDQDVLTKSVKMESKPEFKASEDMNKRSRDKDTTPDILTKPVKDTKMESKPEFMSPHKDIKHGEVQTTEKTTSSSLSPYEAIQRVIDKYKSANEPIPTDLLTNLSYLKIKDPYSEFERINLTVVGHSLSSIARSKSTKVPSTSQLKPTKSWSPTSTSQSKTSKGLSPPSASQSSVGVLSHAEVTPSAPKPKERSFTPKLAFSSGLFSPDAAERNRIIVDLPNSDSSRENYILNEYDCRIKRHIAFQAAIFELLNAKKGLHEVSNLIHQQRKFEEKWPLTYSETTPSEEFFDENIFNTNVEVREIDMTEMIKESQEAVKLLRHSLNSVDSVKQMVAK